MPHQLFRGTMQSCEDKINGVFLLGPFPNTGLPVGALTLIFTQPVANTVTFTGSAGDVLDIDTIISEINTVIGAGKAVKRTETAPPGHTYSARGNVPVPKVTIAIQDDTNGVTITDAGTANSYFGIKTTGGPFVRTAVADAKILHFGPDAGAGHYYVLIGA